MTGQGKPGHNKKVPRKTIENYFLQSPYVFLLIFGIIFLIYGQLLSFSLGKLDEYNILVNNLDFLRDFRNLKEAFLRNPFFNKGGDFYRPLQNVSFMIDAHLSGQNGWGYYLTNIILHGITCSLVFYILAFIGKDKRMALLLTLLFSVHPLFVQTVAWAPSRGDILIAVFGLLSFITFIHFIRSRNYYFLLAHVIAFGLALFSKESAILIPFLCVLYYFLLEKEKKVSVSGLAFPLAGYVILVALFFYIRNDLVGIVVPKEQFGLIPLLHNLRTVPEILVRFVLPFKLSPMPAFSGFMTIAGMILFVLLVFLSVRYHSGSDRLFLFGLTWFLAFLVPALVYINKYGSTACDYMEHRGYFPMIGIILILYQLINHGRVFPKFKNAGGYLLLFVIVLGIYSFLYARVYRDPIVYYDRATETNPKSAVAYFCRGTVYMTDKKNYPTAIRDFEQAMRLKPDYAQAYLNRGFCREQMDDPAGALEDYRTASRLSPASYDPHVNMAAIYASEGLQNEAIREYDTALMLYPGFAEGYHARGMQKQKLQDYTGALEDLNRAISLKETYDEAYLDRGVMKFQLQDFQSALEDFNQAILLNSKYPVAYLNRGILKFQMQDYQAALSDLNMAIFYNDKYDEAYLNRGKVRYLMGDAQGACEDWTIASRLGNAEAENLMQQYCNGN